MSITPCTGIFSRLPPALNITSGPTQARLKSKVCCQSTMFSGLWCDSHANNRYLLLKMCYAVKLFSVIFFELMYNLGSAFLLLSLWRKWLIMVGFYWSLKRSQNKRMKGTKIKGWNTWKSSIFWLSSEKYLFSYCNSWYSPEHIMSRLKIGYYPFQE